MWIKVLIGLGVVVLLAVAAMAVVARRQILSLTAQITTPGCPNGPLFSVSPIQPEQLKGMIVPLGNLNPPDHTIPTDHLYLNVKSGKVNDPNLAVPIVAPGDITVESIQRSTTNKQGEIFTDDYAINFRPCKDIRANFGHVSKLAPALAQAYERAKPSCHSNIPREGDTYTYCDVGLNLTLKAGEPIGETGGGNTRGLDWQLIDYRSTPLQWANPKRYRDEQLHFVCALDYFDPQTKAILYEKLGSENKKRTIEPRCGEVEQDVPGTAQGNWINGEGTMDMPETWSKTLALVHDNIDPSVGVFSIGGVIGKSGKIHFTPSHEGAINREFSEVTPGDTVYCYQGETVRQGGGAFNERVIIQLTGDTTLQAEFQTGACSQSVNFSNPTIYER